MKFSIRIVSLVIVCSMFFSNFSVAFASNEEYQVDKKEMLVCLVENGYTLGTAKALGDKDIERIYKHIENKNVLDVYTCSMEINNLADLESYLSYEREELLDMGSY